MEEQIDLLEEAYEELLELRGMLCDHTTRFNPRMEELEKYWNSPKPEWEKKLNNIIYICP